MKLGLCTWSYNRTFAAGKMDLEKLLHVCADDLKVGGMDIIDCHFKSGDPARRAAAIVKAVTHYQDAGILAEVSKNLGEPMVGINVSQMPEAEKIAGRGW